MRAAFIYGAGDVRVDTVPDPAIVNPTDAIVRITRSCICGSDLHRYHNLPASSTGTPIGHEFIGVVEETGSEVRNVKKGDFVISPFVYSCGHCEFCLEGLYTSCLTGGFWGSPELGAAQAEIIRVPLADGTLVVVPGMEEDSEFAASLLTLSDVYATGYHAAVKAGVGAGDTVAVIGDGAVGLLAVLSAKQLGAERIILMGRHKARTDLGVDFGATDVVAERGEEGINKVIELSGGHGVPKVLEAVGMMPAYEQAIGIVREGGVISRVGVPQYQDGPVGGVLFNTNKTLTGGVAPARKYTAELLPGILDGSVNPGRVFDTVIGMDGIPDGYAAMDNRTSLKVMIKP